MPVNKNSQASSTVHTGKLSKATTTLCPYAPASPTTGLATLMKRGRVVLSFPEVKLLCSGLSVGP